jgi:molybdopterin/thiamine biosynthesis adenylyltransferase
MNPNDPLSESERQRYEWQMWIPDLGEEGQLKIRQAKVLISRVGGLGGLAAYELAAAGVGTLILAHAGNVKPSDLNRQLLMQESAIGSSRVQTAANRLRAFNPYIQIVEIPENISTENADRLVRLADVVVCCVPKFEERLALNEACVRANKPMVDCAMYEFTCQVTTIIPHETACVACRVPEVPPTWKRQFPVLGAVPGVAGCLGAIEAIKLITGIGEPLKNRLALFDLKMGRFRTLQLQRRGDCSVCGQKHPSADKVI